jgi:serine/threonine-protein kinase
MEEATAIGGFPTDFVRPEPGESTVEERGRGRGNAAAAAVPIPPPRRLTPQLDPDTQPRARRPATSPSRRPLVEEEEPSQSISLTQPTANQRIIRGGSDEGGESISVTPPTTGQRPGSRQFSKPLVREEDSILDTESGVDAPDHTDHAYDAEDDESTAGYESEHEAPARRGRGMLLAVVAVLVLVVLGAVAFLALSSSPSQPTEEFGPPPPQPMKDPNAPPAPSAEAPSTPPEAAPEGVAEASPTAEPGTEPAPSTEAPSANPAGEAAGTPGETAPGATPAPTAVVAAVAPAENPATVTSPKPATEPLEPPRPSGVPVKFKTSSTTATIWVNGRKVEPNKVLQIPAGTIRVRFVCSTHKRPNKGSFVQTLKEGQDKTREFSIPCRKGHR